MARMVWVGGCGGRGLVARRGRGGGVARAVFPRAPVGRGRGRGRGCGRGGAGLGWRGPEAGCWGG